MLFWGDLSKATLTKSKKRCYLVGGLSIFMGIVSMAMPMLATIAIETIVGVLMFGISACEAIAVYRGFRDDTTPWQAILMTIISFAVGVIFFVRPIAGIMTLTFLLAAYFCIDGISKVFEYFRLRTISGSLWILVSGILGIVLAFMMWNNVFAGAMMIGFILGMDLLISGFSLVALGRGCSTAAKDLPDEETKKDGKAE